MRAEIAYALLCWVCGTDVPASTDVIIQHLLTTNAGEMSTQKGKNVTHMSPLSFLRLYILVLVMISYLYV